MVTNHCVQSVYFIVLITEIWIILGERREFGTETSFEDTSGVLMRWSLYCRLGYDFDGLSYVESSAVMDYYTQTVGFIFSAHEKVSIWFYLTRIGQRSKRTLLSNRDSSCGSRNYGDLNTNGFGIYIDVVSAEEQWPLVRT